VSQVSAYLAQATLALVLLIALAVAALWAMRRWPGMTGIAAGRRLAVVDSVPLGLGARLVLVRADDREFLLAITPQTVSMVSELLPTAPPADQQDANKQ
jgi:flagellar protein FliO/FliZ